jgi:hypothetical protein
MKDNRQPPVLAIQVVRAVEPGDSGIGAGQAALQQRQSGVGVGLLQHAHSGSGIGHGRPGHEL